jgi:hypothetical protein
MVELAAFYSWTLDYIRSLTVHEIDIAREYMLTEKKRQGGENGGSKRH